MAPQRIPIDNFVNLNKTLNAIVNEQYSEPNGKIQKVYDEIDAFRKKNK